MAILAVFVVDATAALIRAERTFDNPDDAETVTAPEAADSRRSIGTDPVAVLDAEFATANRLRSTDRDEIAVPDPNEPEATRLRRMATLIDTGLMLASAKLATIALATECAILGVTEST